MFGSLIRRKPARSAADEESAFESTTFSLSTAVPRPGERLDDRVLPMLRLAKMITPRGDQLLRVRNVSAGGLMAETVAVTEVGDVVVASWAKTASSGRPRSHRARRRLRADRGTGPAGSESTTRTRTTTPCLAPPDCSSVKRRCESRVQRLRVSSGSVTRSSPRARDPFHPASSWNRLDSLTRTSSLPLFAAL